MKKPKKNCQMILQVLVQAYQQWGTTERKILSMWFPFHHPSPHKRKRRVALSTHWEPNEMKKIRFWSFSNMNLKHIIIVIIFIIRLNCLVHTSLYMDTVFKEWRNYQNKPFNAFIARFTTIFTCLIWHGGTTILHTTPNLTLYMKIFEHPINILKENDKSLNQ